MEEGFLGGFEWDEEKRKQTLLKHGIDFVDAIKIFERKTLLSQSMRGDEQRWTAIGLLDGTEIAVIYTMRGDTCRIITARRARRHKRKEYHARYPGRGS